MSAVFMVGDAVKCINGNLPPRVGLVVKIADDKRYPYVVLWEAGWRGGYGAGELQLVAPAAYTAPASTVVAFDHLDKVSDNLLWTISDRVLKEMNRRTKAVAVAAITPKPPCTKADYDGFCNFLTGVAHAMACRAALRLVSGQKPIGPGLTKGTPWNPVDGALVERAVVHCLWFFANDGKYNKVKLHSNPLFWRDFGGNYTKEIQFNLSEHPDHPGYPRYMCP